MLRQEYEGGKAMPLEVMLDLMRYHLKLWQDKGDDADKREAGMWAQASAPYVHPARCSQRSTQRTPTTLSNSGYAPDVAPGVILRPPSPIT
jgi:hypothetical protein